MAKRKKITEEQMTVLLVDMLSSHPTPGPIDSVSFNSDDGINITTKDGEEFIIHVMKLQ